MRYIIAKPSFTKHEKLAKIDVLILNNKKVTFYTEIFKGELSLEDEISIGLESRRLLDAEELSSSITYALFNEARGPKFCFIFESASDRIRTLRALNIPLVQGEINCITIGDVGQKLGCGADAKEIRYLNKLSALVASERTVIEGEFPIYLDRKEGEGLDACIEMKTILGFFHREKNIKVSEMLGEVA